MSRAEVRMLIVHPNDPRGGRGGGIESFIDGVIRHAPRDFRIEYVGVGRDRGAPRRAWLPLNVGGKTVHFLSLFHEELDVDRERIPLTARFGAALLRARSDIHTAGRIVQTHRPGLVLPLIDRNCVKTHVVHLTATQEFQTGISENRWGKAPWLYGAVERLVVPRLTRLYAVNESVVEEYRDRYSDAPERFQHLSTWADTDLFHPPQDRRQDRAQVAADFGLAGTGALVIFVGRLEPVKDPRLAIHAFARLADRLRNAEMLVVGAGSLGKVLGEAVRQAGLGKRVRFTGLLPRERVARLMRAADAQLLSSKSEAMPVSVLESLVSGLPVVATPVGNVASVVQSGVTGWIASTHAPDELARGLEWVLSQDREAMEFRCVAAGAQYDARRVLERFYEDQRRIADAHEHDRDRMRKGMAV